MTPELLGHIYGERLAVAAIRLRRAGLPVERWEEYFPAKVGELAEQFGNEAERARLQDCLLRAYGDVLDNRIEEVLLTIDPPAGRA